ncbi:TPA: virulence protein [Serratia marcescens]|nr:virulence protein [Serratia marcescens]
MHNTENITLQPPSLPSGGGAITGSFTVPAGPDGNATLSLPLPISKGRGYAPDLSLNYASQAGNGPFGIGWSVGMPAVSRRTRMGVPTWDTADEFLAPNGEVLVPIQDANGAVQTTLRDTLLGVTLGEQYQVIVMQPCIVSDFSRFEYWQSPSVSCNDFWVLYAPDGQMHLLGYDKKARITDPDNPSHVARWLLCASVNAVGEQIWYEWQSEDDMGCEIAELQAHQGATAQRYLQAVHYGNLVAARTFANLSTDNVAAAGWLFVLVLDYGERSAKPEVIPTFETIEVWPIRQDCFSSLEYGFDVRTRRLCRQVIMFHRLQSLAGESTGIDTPEPVARLLLTYDESPYISTLTAVQSVANDTDGSPVMLPPIGISWQTFSLPEVENWQVMEMGSFVPQGPWQYVDLMGEGIAGLLWQDRGAWWYRAPVRQTGSKNVNATMLDAAQPLPTIPVLRQGATLTDLNGDGRLQWLVSNARVNGHYDPNLTQPGEWLNFTPLDAMPVEFLHPQAQLADLTGSGFADLVMIGPRSVRLYVGQGNTWARGQTVQQSGNVVLPVPGADPASLVAFSDLLGSGQQHLIQINADGVTCWPNLGHGRFGQPVNLPGFSMPAGKFNPDQVYLADTDGSGTTDILYAQSDALMLWRNQSGNAFAEPVSLLLPDGVSFDRTCSLQVADIQGLGVASLLLTVPHPTPRHYVLNMATEKPWLAASLRNNIGMNLTLSYRSSVQFWLDEKAEAAAQQKAPPVCHLPFPVHTLWKTVSQDEITGNTLTREMRYRHGAWDGREREFRGFGYVESREIDTAGYTSETPLTHSSSRQWFATGLAVVDDALRETFWHGDTDAFPDFIPRYTSGSAESEVTCTAEQQETYAYWLARAGKGQLLRSELYGEDGTPLANIPYTVSTQRQQARLISGGMRPVIWPSVVESRSYHYERVAADPQCSQQVTLASDDYGMPLRTVEINYPRRPQPAVSPYPDTLPETLFASSYADQQQELRLSLTRSDWHHLVDILSGVWVTALPNATRQDILTGSIHAVPAAGLNLEALQSENSLVADNCPRQLAGQTQTFWLNAAGQPTTDIPDFPPRQAYLHQAELEPEMVDQLYDLYPEVDFTRYLANAGYLTMDYLFPSEAESSLTLWAVQSGATRFGTAAQFWRPLSWQDSPLTGWHTLDHDPHYCVVTASHDPAGLSISATYDWRFLHPITVTDENDNLHQVSLDALGRVVATWFSGTENDEMVGFSGKDFTAPQTADAALALTSPLPVAACWTYVTDSWMQIPPVPPHVVALTADRYDNDPQQQIRQQVVLSDGFGRTLQSSLRMPEGAAWQLSTDGALVAENGAPVLAQTNFRWAVSGRTEFDGKGQVVRTYQPYYLNDWRHVSDDSARQDLYAETHVYDPVGREVRVQSALRDPQTGQPYYRQLTMTPWFTVSEDENDTRG